MEYPTADISWLAEELGSEFEYGCAKYKEKAFKALTENAEDGAWAAEFRDARKVGHVVAVDGLNDLGEVMIRDPEGVRYELTQEDFIEFWNGRFVYKK